MTRILLVSPSFHGYWRSIAQAFEARGYDVVAHLYDSLPNAISKARHKLAFELPRQIGVDSSEAVRNDLTSKAVRALAGARPDVVVTVKGDLLGTDWRVATQGIPRVTWLYDELRRMRYQPGDLAEAGPIASYSALDVATLRTSNIDATYLPLAFDQRLGIPQRTHWNPEVVFIGARYPKREVDLLALAAAGIPVRAFGRFWSRHVVDRARTWQWRRPDLTSGRDLSRPDAYRWQAEAAAAINVHGDQDGFTMRTFEVCGVGGLQLIDRPDVGELYEPDRELLVFTNTEELIEGALRALGDPSGTERIREAAQRRTLAHHTFDHRIAVLEELWD